MTKLEKQMQKVISMQVNFKLGGEIAQEDRRDILQEAVCEYLSQEAEKSPEKICYNRAFRAIVREVRRLVIRYGRERSTNYFIDDAETVEFEETILSPEDTWAKIDDKYWQGQYDRLASSKTYQRAVEAYCSHPRTLGHSTYSIAHAIGFKRIRDMAEAIRGEAGV